MPLIMRLPGEAEAGRRVAALSQPIDLPATLLEAFGSRPPAMDGLSLLPWAKGKQGPIRPFSFSAWQMGDEMESALRTPDWKLIVPSNSSGQASVRDRQLYVKPEDRWEINNVVQHHLELADELEQKLQEFIKSDFTFSGEPLTSPLAPAPRSPEARG